MNRENSAICVTIVLIHGEGDPENCYAQTERAGAPSSHHGGETNTVELKLASPRPAEMAERLCGMANAHDSRLRAIQ